MINRLIDVALRNRFLVIAVYLGLAGWGWWALAHTPIDAIGQEREQRRFDAEHCGAIANQRSGFRNVDCERAAELVDESRRRQHAGAYHEVSEQQRPTRPDLSIIHAELSASL